MQRDYPHSSTHLVQTGDCSLIPSRQKEGATEHSEGGRAPLLLSAYLGNGYRHWQLWKQLPPDALHSFTHELSLWMFSLHYCFHNKLSYFYPEVRP